MTALSSLSVREESAVICMRELATLYPSSRVERGYLSGSSTSLNQSQPFTFRWKKTSKWGHFSSKGYQRCVFIHIKLCLIYPGKSWPSRSGPRGSENGRFWVDFGSILVVLGPTQDHFVWVILCITHDPWGFSEKSASKNKSKNRPLFFCIYPACQKRPVRGGLWEVKWPSKIPSFFDE